MGIFGKTWIVLRAIALAIMAAACTGVGTAFALYSFGNIFLGRGHGDPMDFLGFVFGAVGWLVGWWAWRLARNRAGAWLVKWVLIAVGVLEPVVFVVLDSVSGMMMRA